MQGQIDGPQELVPAVPDIHGAEVWKGHYWYVALLLLPEMQKEGSD